MPPAGLIIKLYFYALLLHSYVFCTSALWGTCLNPILVIGEQSSTFCKPESCHSPVFLHAPPAPSLHLTQFPQILHMLQLQLQSSSRTQLLQSSSRTQLIQDPAPPAPSSSSPPPAPSSSSPPPAPSQSCSSSWQPASSLVQLSLSSRTSPMCP